MKKRIILLTVFISFVFTMFFSCKEMDDVYQEYVVPGGKEYPGKPRDLVAYSGMNRIKLSWTRGNDPSITHARVFWNYFTDSLELNITAEMDSLSCIIDNLEENNYSFVVRHYNKNGDVSLSSEVLGVVYGENYASGLRNRVITSLEVNPLGQYFVKWGAPDVFNGVVGTEVKYVDTLHNDRIEFITKDEDLSVITTISNFQYRTLFVPDSLSVDTFYTDFQMNDRKALILKDDWSVADFSTQHNTSASNIVTNIIDGNSATRWHTHLTNSSYPHFVTIDMGFAWNLSGFDVYRRDGDVRGCDTFQFMVSMDNSNWVDAGTYDFDRLIDGAQNYQLPAPVKGRFFKFIGLTGPENFMLIGELSAYGTLY